MKLSLYCENKAQNTSTLYFETDGKNHKFHNMGLHSTLNQNGIKVPHFLKDYYKKNIIKIEDPEFLEAFKNIYTKQVLNNNSPYSENTFVWKEEN